MLSHYTYAPQTPRRSGEADKREPGWTRDSLQGQPRDRAFHAPPHSIQVPLNDRWLNPHFSTPKAIIIHARCESPNNRFDNLLPERYANTHIPHRRGTPR